MLAMLVVPATLNATGSLDKVTAPLPSVETMLAEPNACGTMWLSRLVLPLLGASVATDVSLMTLVTLAVTSKYDPAHAALCSAWAQQSNATGHASSRVATGTSTKVKQSRARDAAHHWLCQAEAIGAQPSIGYAAGSQPLRTTADAA